MSYNIGDVIVMNEKANQFYSYTQEGAIGIVLRKEADGEHYKVAFISSTLSQPYHEHDCAFGVSEEAMELRVNTLDVRTELAIAIQIDRIREKYSKFFKTKSKPKGPYDAVCNKIKLMELKRKEQGYAF